MNFQDFQNLCTDLKHKYEDKALTDSDVDIFADVISNILNRDDLKESGTAYSELSSLISGNYEADIEMNPLLARMYELCRMYENFRARPLTELEQKEIEESKIGKSKRSVTFSIYYGTTPIANCWFEDLTDAGYIAEKAADIVDVFNGFNSVYDDNGDINYTQLALQMATIDCRIDPMDEESLSCIEHNNRQSVIVKDRANGILCLGPAQERNRVRKNPEIKIDINSKRVNMESYVIYGLDYYTTLYPNDIDIDSLNAIDDEMLEYSFEQAHNAAECWMKIEEPFKIPGSDKLIGMKKPLPTMREINV